MDGLFTDASDDILGMFRGFVEPNHEGLIKDSHERAKNRVKVNNYILLHLEKS